MTHRNIGRELVAVPFENTMRSLSRDSRSAGMRFVVGGVVLLAAWSVIAFTVELPLSVSSVDGRVVAAVEPAEISSVSREPIIAVHVRLGDRVNEGDLLVQFDSVSQALELEIRRERIVKLTDELGSVRHEIDSVDAEASSEIEAFDQAIDRLRARLGESEARVEHAVTAERLYGELRSERRIDALQYSQARSNLEQSRKSLQAEQAELREKAASKQLAIDQRVTTRARLGRELARLTGEVAELAPRIAQLERRVTDLSVRAPFAGAVGAMAGLAAGQTLEPGTWMLTLVPQRGLEFEAHFSAEDAAGRVATNQVARIEFFALPWTQYGLIDAKVTRVGTEERDDRVRVYLQLDEGDELYDRLAHGLKGRATVMIEETTLARKLVNLLGSTRTH